MYIGRISTIFGAILLALTVPVVAGPTRVLPSKFIAPPAPFESVYYRCRYPYRWVPDGTIAGPTGGYPYYGWYGYPYVPYRCVRLHNRRYRHPS